MTTLSRAQALTCASAKEEECLVDVMVRAIERGRITELQKKGRGWVGREVSKTIGGRDQRPSKGKVLF